jgi:hypothetical protein
VTVRPLPKITGDSEFNEVFLDGALIADEDRLGTIEEEPIARTVLMHERAILSGAGSGLRERTSGASIDRLPGRSSRSGVVGHRPHLCQFRALFTRTRSPQWAATYCS